MAWVLFKPHLLFSINKKILSVHTGIGSVLLILMNDHRKL